LKVEVKFTIKVKTSASGLISLLSPYKFRSIFECVIRRWFQG